MNSNSPLDVEHIINALLAADTPLHPSRLRELLVRIGIKDTADLEHKIFDVMLLHPQIFILLTQGRWGLQKWATNENSEVYRYVFASKHGGIWRQINDEWVWFGTCEENSPVEFTPPKTQKIPVQETPPETIQLNRYRIRAIIRMDAVMEARDTEDAITRLKQEVEQSGDALLDILIIDDGE